MNPVFIVVLALLLIGATYKWKLHPLIVSLVGGVVFSALFRVVEWSRGGIVVTNLLTNFLLYILIYGLVIAIVCLLAARPFGEWWVKNEASEGESAAEPEEPGRF